MMGSQSALVMDPSTGFLETTGNFPTPFTGERKGQFIQVYKVNGLRFKKTCKLLGISEHTVNHHFEADPAFRAAFEEVQREYAEDLQCTSMEIALTPKGFMDRIAQLRRLFPGKYAPAENGVPMKIELHVEGDFVMNQKKALEVMDTTISREIETARENAAPTIAHHSPLSVEGSTVERSSGEERREK